MDMENDDNTPIRHEGDENRQVSVWSPEDAARFLSSAIQQAQRPLTDALNKRSVSPGIFALVIVLLVGAAAGCGWVLLDRLEKAENTAENARNLREQALVQQHEIKSKHDVVSAKLVSSQEQLDRVRRDLETENERLRTEATGIKLSEEELRRLKNDVQRYRRHNELMRNQISGLEMEKQALSRQLAAVKAMAAGDDDLFDDLDMSEESMSFNPSRRTGSPEVTATPVPPVAPTPAAVTSPSASVDTPSVTAIPEESATTPSVPEQQETTSDNSTMDVTDESTRQSESVISPEPEEDSTPIVTLEDPPVPNNGSTESSTPVQTRSSILDNENAL